MKDGANSGFDEIVIFNKDWNGFTHYRFVFMRTESQGDESVRKTER